MNAQNERFGIQISNLTLGAVLTCNTTHQSLRDTLAFYYPTLAIKTYLFFGLIPKANIVLQDGIHIRSFVRFNISCLPHLITQPAATMDGRQQPDRNRRRARRNSHTQDGNEDDEYQEPDGSNTHERRHSSAQDGGENDAHQIPHRSPNQMQASRDDDTDEDDGHDGRDENTGRLRPPHTRMPGPSRNAQVVSTIIQLFHSGHSGQRN